MSYSNKIKALRSNLNYYNNENLSIPSPTSPNFSLFDEVFRCYICLQNLSQPTLCPKCSKLCCEPCIKKWLKERKEECPHCRANIDQSQLIPCRFLDDLQEHLRAVLTINENRELDEKVDQCPQHKTKMAYYCHTCQIPICSDCGMIDNKHRDHQFEHLENIYNQRVDGLKSYLDSLRKRMTKFTRKIKEVDRKVQNCTLAKQESDRELVGLINRYRTNLELQLREKHATLFGQRAILEKQEKYLLATVTKLEAILASRSRVEVLQSDGAVINILKQVEQVIVHNSGDNGAVDMTFEKDFLPDYHRFRFRVPNFIESVVNTCTADKPFQSLPVTSNGVTWCLQAYPNEPVGQSSSRYLSLMVHLLSGDLNPAKYYFRVEMHHPNLNESLIREFCFELRQADLKGFKQFCKVDVLTSKGYINGADGQLELIAGLRPLSYKQKARDQSQYIKHLEAQLKQLQANQQEPTTYTSASKPQLEPESMDSNGKPNPLISGSAISETTTEEVYGEVIDSTNWLTTSSPLVATPRSKCSSTRASTNRLRQVPTRRLSLNPEDANYRPRSHSLTTPTLPTNSNRKVQLPVVAGSTSNYNLLPTTLIQPAQLSPTTLLTYEPVVVEPGTQSRDRSNSFHTSPQPPSSLPQTLPRPSNSHNRSSARHSRRSTRNLREVSSDSEYDESMDNCTIIPAFTSTEELRLLIQQELDPTRLRRPNKLNRSRLHRTNRSGDNDNDSDNEEESLADDNYNDNSPDRSSTSNTPTPRQTPRISPQASIVHRQSEVGNYGNEPIFLEELDSETS